MPRLENRVRRDQWTRVFNQAYRAFEDAARGKRRSMIDWYGLEDPAEFFAVVTESFFERPLALRRENEELYQVLANYYRVDPASWTLDAASSATAALGERRPRHGRRRR